MLDERSFLSVFATAVNGFVKPVKLFLKLSMHKLAHNAQDTT